MIEKVIWLTTLVTRTKIFVFAIFMVMFTGEAAFSDVFFTARDSGKNAVVMGNISSTKEGFVVNKKGIAAGDRLFGYNSGSRLLVTAFTAGSDDTEYVYNPTDLSRALTQTQWHNARDVFDATYLRGYLYVACRVSANIVKVDTNFMERKKIDWVYPQRGGVPHVPTGYFAEAVSVTTLGDEIYGLFTLSNGQGEYLNSILVKLADDITTLKTLGYAEVVPNATVVLAFGNELYVAGRGKLNGDANDSRQSLIQKVTPSTMKVTDLVSAFDLDSSGGYIEALSLSQTGDAFIVTHKALAEKTEVKYYLLKGLNSTSKQSLLTLYGGESSLRYDSATKLFWVSSAAGKTDQGAQLFAFDSNGKREVSFQSSELGGIPCSLTIAKGSEESSFDPQPKPKPEPDSGSGGCSVGLGLPFLIWIPLGYCLKQQRVFRRN